MPVGTGEFELTLGDTLDRSAVCRLFAPHAPILDDDRFWDLTALDRLPVICAEVSPAPGGTVVSGLVRPGLDGAELLALAHAVAADARHDVLIEDVTFLGDCPGHVLVVHPDGGIGHAVATEAGLMTVDLDTRLVRLPEADAIQVRLRRDCGFAH